jgi:hypothetical protein
MTGQEIYNNGYRVLLYHIFSLYSITKEHFFIYTKTGICAEKGSFFLAVQMAYHKNPCIKYLTVKWFGLALARYQKTAKVKLR